MFCPSCGAQNADSANACSSCGASLAAPQDPRMAGRVNAMGGGPVPTYLVPSILVTIFCCQIFGIVAIVFSAIAMGKNSGGDFVGAADAAKKAKMWCWLGFGIGAAIWLIYLGFVVLTILAGAAGAAGSGATP